MQRIKDLLLTAQGFLFGPYRYAWHDLREGLEVLVQKPEYLSFAKAWFLSVLGIAVCWEVYVPIHEFLHVAGCLASGGDVHELTLSPMYGASLWQKIFPFVRVSDEYAGRLAGFSTNGSDITYLVTVFAPFVLTVFFGVALLHLATRKRNAFLLGVSLVVAGAPFVSLAGDYLEMGGILVTRAVHDLAALFQVKTFPDLYRFRSDDLFRLISEMGETPLAFGIDGAWGMLRAVSITLASQIVGVILAGWTYHLGRKLTQAIEKRRKGA